MSSESSQSWWSFAAWATLGAAYVFGVLALLSIGIFVLAGAGLLTVLLVKSSRAPHAGVAGAISGASIPLLYVAWLNRLGPGTVCRPIPGGQQCDEQWNPLPFLAIGVVLALLGVAVFEARRRRARSG